MVGAFLTLFPQSGGSLESLESKHTTDNELSDKTPSPSNLLFSDADMYFLFSRAKVSICLVSKESSPNSEEGSNLEKHHLNAMAQVLFRVSSCFQMA